MSILSNYVKKLTSMKYPKTTLPKIAPSLATAKVTAMAVDL